MFFESERDKRAYFSKKDNVCGAHFHRSAELLYTLSGEKTAWLNGKKYTLTAGQLLFSNWLNYYVYQTTPYDIGNK